MQQMSVVQFVTQKLTNIVISSIPRNQIRNLSK